MSRRRRTLSDEEKDLWDQIRSRAEPLQKPRAPLPDPDPQPKPKKRAKPVTPPRDPLPSFRIGAAAPNKPARDDLALTIGEQLNRRALNMDGKLHGKMTRGKLRPDARLDLHGMTMAEAHPELLRFILHAHEMEKRLVLVITGKGKDRDDGGPIPVRHGVLKHQVPHWLHQPPLRQIVLQVTEAHLRHGGSGAYYVYLRRSR